MPPANWQTFSLCIFAKSGGRKVIKEALSDIDIGNILHMFMGHTLQRWTKHCQPDVVVVEGIPTSVLDSPGVVVREPVVVRSVLSGAELVSRTVDPCFKVVVVLWASFVASPGVVVSRVCSVVAIPVNTCDGSVKIWQKHQSRHLETGR